MIGAKFAVAIRTGEAQVKQLIFSDRSALWSVNAEFQRSRDFVSTLPAVYARLRLP